MDSWLTNIKLFHWLGYDSARLHFTCSTTNTLQSGGTSTGKPEALHWACTSAGFIYIRLFYRLLSLWPLTTKIWSLVSCAVLLKDTSACSRNGEDRTTNLLVRGRPTELHWTFAPYFQKFPEVVLEISCSQEWDEPETDSKLTCFISRRLSA